MGLPSGDVFTNTLPSMVHTPSSDSSSFLALAFPFEAVNSINGGTWTVQVQDGEIAFSLTDCVLP